MFYVFVSVILPSQFIYILASHVISIVVLKTSPLLLNQFVFKHLAEHNGVVHPFQKTQNFRHRDNFKSRDINLSPKAVGIRLKYCVYHLEKLFYPLIKTQILNSLNQKFIRSLIGP